MAATVQPVNPAPEATPEDCTMAIAASAAVVPRQADPPDDAPATERTTVIALVTRAQAGDAKAFGELYGRYIEFVIRYVAHPARGRALAEDLAWSGVHLHEDDACHGVGNSGRAMSAAERDLDVRLPLRTRPYIVDGRE
jgi:hypothetical protein